MRELVVEILLRLVKPVLATVLGLGVYYAAVVAGGATQGTELFLVCWLVGAAFVMLVQTNVL